MTLTGHAAVLLAFIFQGTIGSPIGETPLRANLCPEIVGHLTQVGLLA